MISCLFSQLPFQIYGSSNRCLAINNSVILGEGKAVFGLGKGNLFRCHSCVNFGHNFNFVDAEKIAGPFKDAGCIGTDGTFCVNAVVCSILPVRVKKDAEKCNNIFLYYSAFTSSGAERCATSSALRVRKRKD